MNPREIVQRAVEFRRPARMPVTGFDDLGPNSDTTAIGSAEVKPPQAQGDDALDQWCCRWGKTEMKNMGQVKGHPITDLDQIKDFPWPDGNDPRRYEAVPEKLAELQADPDRKDKYVCTHVFMILWERMHSLFGFENCMVALMDDDPRIHEMADRILDYDIAVARNMHRLCGSAIQGFCFTEDWGTETDLQVSPALFERFFIPRYRKLFGIIHECGWHVWMHSCGKINKALSMLINAGLDVVNMQQPRTNGIEEIGREFAGKLCFQTLCDIQKTLPPGDRTAIRTEAQKLLYTWGTPEGGFVLGDYGDEEAIGAQPGTREFMLSTFRELDPWRRVT